MAWDFQVRLRLSSEAEFKGKGELKSKIMSFRLIQSSGSPLPPGQTRSNVKLSTEKYSKRNIPEKNKIKTLKGFNKKQLISSHQTLLHGVHSSPSPAISYLQREK